MNVRRINDILKIVGAVAAVIAALTPVLPDGQLKNALVAIGAFLAGIGTRAIGTEYQDVADAKAVAKTLPPPATLQ